MTKFAFLVEYNDIPPDVDFTSEIATPFMDALRVSSVFRQVPDLVTVFTGDAMDAMVKARKGTP